MKLCSLFQRLRADRQWYNEHPSPSLLSLPLVQFGLLPLIPQSYRNFGKKLLGRTNRPDWVSPTLWKRAQMQERISLASYSPPGCGHAQQDLFGSTIHGGGIHGIELDERTASCFGLESRHPFNDRRLIEFALALPEEQRWRDGSKFILRQAMNGILPRSVRERTDKADFSCIFAHILQKESTAAIFRSLSVASMGWVDGERIWTDYQSMANGYRRGNEAYRFHVSPLWMILGTELWWRAIFLGQSTAPSLRPREKSVPIHSS